MGGLTAALFINAALCYIRFKYDGQGVKDDLKWILVIFLWVTSHSFLVDIPYLRKIAALLASCSAIFLPRLWSNADFISNSVGRQRATVSSVETPGQAPLRTLKPLLFPCRTSHTRIFPKKHSFSYSYLFVGIPIGWQGSSGYFISADVGGHSAESEWTKAFQQRQSSWFSVASTDHLNRGSHVLGLKGKLDEYLQSQKEDPKAYPFAYLITAPRFLGYSFNPASFWYLYNEGKMLKAMIVEVNNTFDERRIYFLKDTGDVDVSSTSGSPKGKSNVEERKSSIELPAINADSGIRSSAKFSNKWMKDFHVSPFNSRKGSYAISAQDPFWPQMSGSGYVNNVITLSSSKDHVKLIARVFSTRESIDPSSLSLLGRLGFVGLWWWVGFVTYPRILKEAGKLFFRRKLHVWHRPEVLMDSIGRQETGDERIIEQFFRNYLRFQVENSELDVALKYTPANASNTAEETFYPKGLEKKKQNTDHITLKITTPLFYSLFAWTSDPEIFVSSLTQTPDAQPRTLYTSHPTLLPSLFRLAQNTPAGSMQSLSFLTRLRWSLLHCLRESPHPLDQHVNLHLPPSLSRLYRATIFKLILSHRLLFGFPVLADLLCAAVRFSLICSCARALSAAFSGMGQALGDGSGDAMLKVSWLRGLSGVGLHLWWLIGRAL